MKASFVLAVAALVLLAGGTASGQGSAVIIKQRARQLRDRNNAEQGVPPPASPLPTAAPAAATASTPAAPLTPQQQLLVRLRGDLFAIKPDAPASAGMKQRLAKDLIAAAQGPDKPSQAAAAKLAEDLASALSEKLLSGATRTRLFQDVNAVLNPQSMAQAQLGDTVSDIQAIFEANNLERKEAAAIAEDAKALATELRTAAAK